MASIAIVVACFLLWLYFALVHPIKASSTLPVSHAPAAQSTHDGVLSPDNNNIDLQADAYTDTDIGKGIKSIPLITFHPKSIADQNTADFENSLNPIIIDSLFKNVSKSSVSYTL